MSRAGSLPVLRHRGFAAFFAAASVSNAAVWMQTIAVPALLFDLTDKAAWLGISAVASLAPQVLISPFAGVLSDRVSRRTILLITQFAMMCSTFVLWGMAASGRITPWWIVGLGFVSGVAGGFQNSTWQAFIPLLVPQAEMLDAVKLNSVQYTLARAIGPAVAGLVLLRWGTSVAIFVNASTYLLVIGVLLVAKPREAGRAASGERVLTALREGASVVWHNLPFRTAVFLAFVSAACGQSTQSLGAAVSRRVFDHPSKDSSWLLTALGCGALLAFAGWTWFGERLRRSRHILLGLVGYALSAAIIASTSIFVVGMFGYAVGGLAHLTTAVGINTLIQGSVPEHMRGRVLSFHLMGIIGGIPVGTYLIGRLGDEFGLRWALLGNAAVLVAIAGALLASGWMDALDVTTMSGERRVAAERVSPATR